MDGYEKEKSPYHGVGMLCLVMIGVPVILYLISRTFFAHQALMYPDLVSLSALVLSSGIGVLLHLSFVIIGVFRESFAVVRARLSEFFDDLKIGVGFALRDYWYNIKTGGLAFLIYFTIMLGTDLGFVFSLLKFLRIAPI